MHRARSSLLAAAAPPQLLLRYKTSSAGPCKILQHPKWGSHVYPATLFAIAPLEDLTRALADAARDD